MPLVTTTEMFKKAYNGGYAINSEKGITGSGGTGCSPKSFSIHIILYQVPNL